MLRIERFQQSLLHRSCHLGGAARGDGGFYGFAPVDLQQEIQSLMNPIAPFGSAIVGDVEDLQSQTRIKLQRARQAVETTFDLLSYDLIEGSLWMDVRKTQDPTRSFGEAPTAVWSLSRQRAVAARPRRAEREQSVPAMAAQFLKATAASTFYATKEP